MTIENHDNNNTIEENKKIGGTKRAATAREELLNIFNDPGHPEHLKKDIYFARKYNVIRHTIYKIREDNKIPPRSERAVHALKGMDTENLTLTEISKYLNIKYQNLYKLVTDNNIPHKRKKRIITKKTKD